MVLLVGDFLLKIFFVENIIETNFFSSTAGLSLKTKKSQKWCSHLKIAWHSKRQKKNIEKREKETNNEKKANNNKKSFFTFTFLYRKIYILLENIFGKTYIINLVYIVIFVLQIFLYIFLPYPENNLKHRFFHLPGSKTPAKVLFLDNFQIIPQEKHSSKLISKGAAHSCFQWKLIIDLINLPQYSGNN